MGISNLFIKDSNAVLDYGFDWSQWLADGETISSASVTLSASTISNPATLITGGSVIVWLTGGEVGTRYAVSCLITTAAPNNRTDERTIKIDVKDR